MDCDIEVTLITCPQDAAERIASDLVHERLAACVNIIPSITSIFRWKGAVEKAEEALLIVKSTVQCRVQLEARALKLHPYSCPEIITLPVQAGFSEYLSWVAGQTATDGQKSKVEEE